MSSSISSVHQPTPPDAAHAAPAGTDQKVDKKLTVLESHGYFLGKTIGTGSYATVRVIISSRVNATPSIETVILDGAQ